MMYKKIVLCFSFFSGQALCMLVNPVDGTYKDKGLALSSKAYMKEMIRASRAGNKQQVGLLIKHEAHKLQRELLSQYFRVDCYDLAALMSIYKKEYDPGCRNFMELKMESKFADLARNPVLCQLSLEQGLSPHIEDEFDKNTLLTRAINEGNSEVVNVLLNDMRTDPNKKDKYGNLPLVLAIDEGNSKTIELLLNHPEIEPNRRVGDINDTPLHLAVKKENLKAIDRLLAHTKIEPNSQTTNGHTPLHYAISINYLEAINLLLKDKKIEPNKEDSLGLTPLHCAIQKSNLQAIRLLLARAEIDLHKKELIKGWTPFHYAIYHEDAGAMILLLNHEKFDPDKEDKYGEASLLCAVAGNNLAPNEAILGKLLDKNKGTNLFWYNFHHYESCNKSKFSMSSLIPTKCTSYKARFFYWYGRTAGFLRRNICGGAVGIKGVIVDTVVTTAVSAAVIVLIALAISSSSSSSNKKESKDNKNKNPYSSSSMGQFDSKMSTNLYKF